MKYIHSGHSSLILFRHFFLRFIKNDLFTENNNLFYKLLFALILVTMFIIFIAIRILEKYMLFPQLSIHSWADLSNYILVSMSVTGIITILEWHVLLPDKKDVINLKPLPVGFLNLYSTKLLSIVCFIFVLSSIISLVPSFMFSVFIQYNSPTLHVIIPLFLCFFMANLFMFFLVSFLSGIIQLFFREKVRELAGFFVQIVFVVIFVSSFILSHGINPYLFNLKEAGSEVLFYYPQLWFTGLFQQWAGSTDPAFAVMGKFAALGFSLLTISYMILLYFSFRNNQNDKSRVKENSGTRNIKEMIRDIFIPAAESQASYLFLKRTFFRKFEVWLGISSFLGLAIGIVLISFVLDSKAGKDFFKDGGDIFAISTICYSIILGLHLVIRTKIETDANWLIRISESRHKKNYRRGIKFFVFTYLLMPLLILTAFVRAYFFGIETTAFFLLFGFAFAFFIYEILFFRLDIFPFASDGSQFSGERVSIWLIKIFGIYLVPVLSLFFWKLLSTHLIHAVLLYILGLLLVLIKKDQRGMDYPFRFESEESDYFLSLDLPE